MTSKRAKTAEEWVKEFPEDLMITIKEKNLENGKKQKIEILNCKYCFNEFIFNSKISNRIREHILQSKSHNKRKKEENERNKKSKQLTIAETIVRVKEREEKSESAIHDFVYALVLSAEPIYKANGALGQVFKKWVPAARTMPDQRNLRTNYLPNLFNNHINFIKNIVSERKISLIIDESPDIIGRKTVNTLISFYNGLKKEKMVLLIDCTASNLINAGKIKVIADNAITKIGKTWNDVINISSDSATYMKKFVESIQITNNSQLVHINDIAHLVHVSVYYGFKIDEMEEVRSLIIKFGNLFLNSNSLLNEFYSLLSENGRDNKKVKQVVDHRWFSYYLTINDIIDLWPYLCEFIDTHNSTKIDKIKNILINETNRIKIFAIFKSIQSFLQPLYLSQKKCESNQPNSQTIYKLVNETIISYLNIEISTSHLESISLKVQKEVKNIVHAFQNAISKKWNETLNRNCDKSVFGKNGFLYKLIIFDPFLKSQMPKDFEFYSDFFSHSTQTQNLNDLKIEFNSYIISDIPDNNDIKVLEYWLSSVNIYPFLSSIAIEYLCIATNSLDAERSFSKLRDIQDSKRTRLSSETLSMEMIMYFNGDIEEKLNY
jgi:hypothetical protein